ncbi:MAG: gliding motility-associated C-terminal domain-containing protein [Bacteroidia bacterium]|nr:gliding motility-associated C-terminal domain-containing protein [Bacteroidia bacterium]
MSFGAKKARIEIKRTRWIKRLCAAWLGWQSAITLGQNPACIEVEAILVNSCPDLQTGDNLPEGLNEMVFMRVGPNPIDLSDAYAQQTQIISFPNGQPNPGYPAANAHLVPPTPATTAIVNQWRASLLNPDCAAIIEVSDQLNPPYTLPAGSRVILIASALFSPNAIDFSQLMDTVYLIYSGNTNTAGRFRNTPDPNNPNRSFRFCAFQGCCDTVTYVTGALSDVNGETVLFDWAGAPTPTMLNCRPPVPPSVPNILSAIVDACEGTATLRGSNVVPYQGQWFVVSVPDGAPEPNFTPHPDSARVTINVEIPGTYRFGRRLILPGACQTMLDNSTQYVDIVFQGTPSAEWAPFDAEICPGETAILMPAEAGGTIEWFLNGQSLGVAPEWETGVAGTYRFVRTVGDCLAESEERTLNVGVLPAPPTVSVSPQRPCPGQNVVLSSPQVVEWFRDNVSIGAGIEHTFVFNAQTAGTYFARVSGECGFADSAPLELALPPVFPVGLSLRADLQNFCDAGAVLSIVNYDPLLSYRWFGPTPFANANASSQTVSQFGVYGFWASNGCDSSEFRLTISETDLPPLELVVSPSQIELCAGATAALSASAPNAQPPVEFSWEHDGAVIGNGAILNVAAPGTYRVTARDACGRRASAQSQATVRSRPTVVPGFSQAICRGAEAEVRLSGGDDYQWLPAPGLSIFDDGARALFSPQNDQTYTCVCVYGPCTDTLRFNVAVVLPPNVVAEADDYEIEQGDNVLLHVRGNGVRYRWNPASGLSDTVGESVVASPAVSTVYTVVAFNDSGCTASDTVEVRVKEIREHHAGVPNVFSPNGDGVNDAIPFFIPEGYEAVEVSIYSRWGQRVFHQKTDLGRAAKIEWDGKRDGGADCPEGVYVFSAEYRGPNRTLFRTGHLTLIR